MRQSAALLTALLGVLVAGCAAEAPPALEAAEDADSRQSIPGGHNSVRDNTTRLWEHTVTYTLEASPPSATMEIPANMTDLYVRVVSRPTSPCGANVGEADNPLGPYADFVAPSGSSTRVELSAHECNAGGLAVYSLLGGTGLEDEAGVWQVTFHGRGTGLQQTLIVEGQPGA